MARKFKLSLKGIHHFIHAFIHSLIMCVTYREMCCNFFNFKIEEKRVAVELRTSQCHTSAVKSEESQLLAWDIKNG